MQYFKFREDSHKRTPEQNIPQQSRIKECISDILFSPLLLFYWLYEKLSPSRDHFPSDVNNVDTWYLEYEDEDEKQNYMNREVGMRDDGSYAVMAPHDDFYGFWTDEDMDIDWYKKHYDVQMITKEEFDKVWDGCVKAMLEKKI